MVLVQILGDLSSLHRTQLRDDPDHLFVHGFLECGGGGSQLRERMGQFLLVYIRIEQGGLECLLGTSHFTQEWQGFLPVRLEDRAKCLSRVIIQMPHYPSQPTGHRPAMVMTP
jgi:hypothetical protein